MDTAIIVALIACAGSVIGSAMSNNKSFNLIKYRLDQIEKKVDEQKEFSTKLAILEEKLECLEKEVNKR